MGTRHGLMKGLFVLLMLFLAGCAGYGSVQTVSGPGIPDGTYHVYVYDGGPAAYAILLSIPNAQNPVIMKELMYVQDKGMSQKEPYIQAFQKRIAGAIQAIKIPNTAGTVGGYLLISPTINYTLGSLGKDTLVEILQGNQML